MLKLVLPLLLVGSNAFASISNVSCFKALDTSKMTANIYTYNDEENEIQQIVDASLKLYTEKISYIAGDSRKPVTQITDMADLKIKTNKGVAATSSSFLDKNFRRYAIECDGGNMKVKKNSDGSVTIVTDYIRADIEGCDGELSITTPGTVFSPAQCEAPATN